MAPRAGIGEMDRVLAIDIFCSSAALLIPQFSQMAWLGIFSSTIVPNSYAATGIRTHDSQCGRVAPDWDLSDALPTEIHDCGHRDLSLHIEEELGGIN